MPDLPNIAASQRYTTCQLLQDAILASDVLDTFSMLFLWGQK